MRLRINSVQFHKTRETYMNSLLQSRKQTAWHQELLYKPHTWNVADQSTWRIQASFMQGVKTKAME